jgi:Do/DeqQ family serine protease
MKTLLGWIRWASPWVALGLAAALVAVYFRPELLRPRETAGDALGTQPQPAAATAGPEAASGAAPAAQPPAEATAGTMVSYADAVEKSAPAVVNVYSERVVRVPSVQKVPPNLSPYFGDMWNSYRDRVERSLGSGVIYDDKGHIVTNYHVIAEATQINVQLRDGREAPAEVVGTDQDTDLAVLHIKLAHLPEIKMGRSDRLRVGDPVLAIGNPMGLGQTVTQGIISATGRGRLGVSTFESFIQTDAAINFGNSGGALVDDRGELIGINTAIIARNAGIEGIGFAIPVDLVRGVVDAILSKGRVIRGWIGIRPQSLKPEECRQFGFPEGSVIVTAVYRSGPAASGGVQPGDVITQVNGQAVNGAEDLLSRIASQTPGQSVQLTIRRGPPFEGPPREHSAQIQVIERPPQAAATS